MVLKEVLLSSAALSFAVGRLLPQYSLGLFKNAILLFFGQVLAYAVWSIVIYPRVFSPLRSLPTPKGDYWLGQTKQVMAEPSGWPHREWSATVPNDGLMKYSVWFRDRIFVTTPTALSEVLVTKNYDFVKPHHVRLGLGRLLGVGVLLAEGDEHKVQRKNLMPAFAFRHIKELYPVFFAKSRELVQCVSELEAVKTQNATNARPSIARDGQQHAPGSIELGGWFSRATLDIIGLSGMGQDFNSLRDPSNRLNQTYQTVFNPPKSARYLQVAGFFIPHRLLQLLPFKQNLNIMAASKYIREVCRDMIAKKHEKMRNHEKTEVDILSVALQSGGFTDESLVDQMMTFLAAGHETTASSMQWALYVLCKHPDIQKKLRDEVRKKIPSLNHDVTASDIDECHYLQAVCSEVLRLWAPVPLTLRVAAVDTSVSGHFVPKGTTVILAPAAVNTSKQLWGGDALDFRPERFLGPDGKSNNQGSAKSNYSFLTFLHGPRSCIGQKFAVAEFACILAAWVGSFETTFEEGSPLIDGKVEVRGGVTTKPAGGLWCNVKPVPGW